MTSKKELEDALAILVDALDRQCLDRNGTKYGYSLRVDSAINRARQLLPRPLSPTDSVDIMEKRASETHMDIFFQAQMMWEHACGLHDSEDLTAQENCWGCKYGISFEAPGG